MPNIQGFCLFGENALLPFQKCPPISFDKMPSFKMPFFKRAFLIRAFCQEIWKGIFEKAKGHFTFALSKCPPMPHDKILLFVMPFLKRAF